LASASASGFRMQSVMTAALPGGFGNNLWIPPAPRNAPAN